MPEHIREKTIAVVLNKSTNYVLLGFIFICIISYVYFANIAVRTLTLLEKSKQEMQSLSIEVSEMESRRLLIDNGIDSNLAEHLGFIEVENQTFIVDKSDKTAFSFGATID